MFDVRLAKEYNIDLKYSGDSIYSMLYDNEAIKDISDILFSDKMMLKTFPNLKVMKKNGEVILVRDILTDINPYYYKINIWFSGCKDYKNIV